MASVLDAEVSWFNCWSEPDKPRGPVKLSYWLTHCSTEFNKRVDQIRSTTDEKQRKSLKNQMPGITPHGQFRYRNAQSENLIAHSCILCIDIDQQDNRHLTDFDQMKTYMSQLPEVAYCGQSVSGTGYFLLIPIAYPDRHSEQFDALIELFAAMNIIVDTSGRNIDRFRFYSYDPAPYINHTASRFTGLPKPKPIRHTPQRSFQPAKPIDEGALLARLASLVRNAGDGQKHHELLKAARLAGGFVAGGQLSEQTAVELLEYEIANRADVADIQAAFKTIRAGIAYGLTEPIYAPERAPNQSAPQQLNRSNNTWLFKGELIRGEVIAVDNNQDYPPDWDTPTDQSSPLLLVSPNRSAFASHLGLVPNQLPLYRLIQGEQIDQRTHEKYHDERR